MYFDRLLMSVPGIEKADWKVVANIAVRQFSLKVSC